MRTEISTLQCKLASQVLATAGLGLTKASILVFYRNIFTVHRFRLVANVMLAIVFAWTVSIFFANLFLCYPVTALIEAFYGNKCVNGVAVWFASTISDVIIDIVILAMPIPMVLRLQLPLKQRLGVLVTFLLGATYDPHPQLSVNTNMYKRLCYQHNSYRLLFPCG